MSSWVSEDSFLTRAQMQNNAGIIAEYMRERGWSSNAIAAMLGNMEAESTISPGRYEVGGTGFGLVQWTPPEKLWAWIRSTYGNTDYTNGYYQLNRILWEVVNGGQWYNTSSYPLSFSAFTTSTLSVTYLAGAWLLNYERPVDQSAAEQARRGAKAEYWYDYITGATPPVKPVGNIEPWLYFKFRRC